jgi:hypothetical protein
VEARLLLWTTAACAMMRTLVVTTHRTSVAKKGTFRVPADWEESPYVVFARVADVLKQ